MIMITEAYLEMLCPFTPLQRRDHKFLRPQLLNTIDILATTSSCDTRKMHFNQ